MTQLHPTVRQVTDRVVKRSASTRVRYLSHIDGALTSTTARSRVGCGNLADSFAAAPDPDTSVLRALKKPNVAIITSYNDMLSAHQPYGEYPRQLKRAVASAGGIAQVAGGYRPCAMGSLKVATACNCPSSAGTSSPCRRQ